MDRPASLERPRRIDFTPYPHGWIEMPPLYHYVGRGRKFVLRPETRLLHYCGIPDKQLMLRLMHARYRQDDGSGG